MRYFPSAADDELARRYARRLRETGVDVVEEYDPGAVILSIGGDGAILYNARRYPDPTILPVAKGDSEGNKIQIAADQVVDRIDAFESGQAGVDYHVETHYELGAYAEDALVRENFVGMNDVQLHHDTAVRAAKFAVRIYDDGLVYETPKVVADGLLVATPFGSTAYYRSITGGTFESGIGVAFNNCHKPDDAPEFLVLSESARVELELLETDGTNAALYRDDDPDSYRPTPGVPVEIRRSESTVELLRVAE